jgi:hypothetical protein
VSRVSHTPTYDQLRGERINVDVPASQAGVPARPADPEPLTRPGRHHLRDDAPTAVAAFGPSPRSGAGLAEDWPGFRTGDSDPRGKHAVPDDPPGATEVSGPFREPGADLAEGWSWFGTGKPASAAPVTTARAVHCSAESPGRRHPPPTNDDKDAEQQGLPGPASHAVLSPPVHGRHRPPPGELMPAANSTRLKC